MRSLSRVGNYRRLKKKRKRRKKMPVFTLTWPGDADGDFSRRMSYAKQALKLYNDGISEEEQRQSDRAREARDW